MAGVPILNREPTFDDKIRDSRDAYARDGVARIPGVFTREETDLMRADALMSLSRLDAIRRNGYPHQPLETVRNGDVEFPGLVFWPCLASAYLERVRRDPRLRAIVSAYLGPDVKQLNNQIYYRLPSDPDSFAWHQDIVFRQPREEYPEIETGYLQTAIAVDEIRGESGAIEFFPGSHKLGDLKLVDSNYAGLRGFAREPRHPRLNGIQEMKYFAQPGDVLVWSSLVVHGSDTNGGSRSRMIYMNGFCRASSARKWPNYLTGGRPAALDPSAIP